LASLANKKLAETREDQREHNQSRARKSKCTETKSGQKKTSQDLALLLAGENERRQQAAKKGTSVTQESDGRQNPLRPKQINEKSWAAPARATVDRAQEQPTAKTDLTHEQAAEEIKK
jgi:hypothetical protein